ncbi:MAG: T9SS type A sorting domain-containing protein [Bacteroidales bacterium]|nr:T9SS type A sorting domain-containing protein [Bacteroidales bacterium]
MKKLLLFSVYFSLLGLIWAQGEHKRVLFVGNSYTEVNNLPLMVQRVAESAGSVLEYQSNTPGGCRFSQHCTNQSMNLIRQGGWDCVVLQEQSQLPSFPQSQVEEEVFPYAQRLVDSVYAHNPDGEAMFYMTWGRKNGDQQNAPYFPVLGTYEGMDSLLYERYLYMARQFDASVCPVGRVWRYLRANSPHIELYQPDESHPSVAGSYVAACAFYTLLFHRSPLSITYSPGIEERDASIIREAVQHVVFDTLSFWLRQSTDTSHVDTTQHDTTQVDTTQIDTTQVGIYGNQFPTQQSQFSIYPNPTVDVLTVSLPPQSSICVAILSDMSGRKIRSIPLTTDTSTFSLSNLPKGIYMLTLVSPSDRYITHVIKR